ncbi:MAG: substrate-binding domain-containing protein [Deltaproteobacteria bacterium]|nr:substrate-binding domain-containing protein [Deltaproteobacteria bacterium]
MKELQCFRIQRKIGIVITIMMAFFLLFCGSSLAGDEFKIGFFSEHTGPAALFGETARACAGLALEEINNAGGILGKPVKLIHADGGQPPADAAKTAVKLMFQEKVDFIMGSHNSAVKDALVSIIKAKVPYLYTPIYEGGECAKNVFITADTTHQAIKHSIPWLTKKHNLKKWYFIGNDLVWPRTVNKLSEELIRENGGEVIKTEYVPFGAANKFEEIVTRIKGANPDIVLVTLIGGDNVNFNRTFAGFGLDKNIIRLAGLLEENTLTGIGADNSKGMYSCTSYFKNINSDMNNDIKKRLNKKFNGKPPQLSILGMDCYSGLKFIQALVAKAGSMDAGALKKAAQGLVYQTPGGPVTVIGNHATKNMYLAETMGAEFKIVETFEQVESGVICP